MSAVGIDFGTSNCFAHVACADRILPVKLDGEQFGLSSVVFAARREIEPRQVAEAEVVRRLRSAQADTRRGRRDARPAADDASLERMVRETLRREAADAAHQAFQEQTFFSALGAGQRLVFGAEALRQHFAEPLSGFLVKSPKSFLGSEMDESRLRAFEDIITLMLQHIRSCAENLVQSDLNQVVLGRPVRYQGIGGDAADAQAIGVMERAARRAGFLELHFELEPLAAAYEYEQVIAQEQCVLVIDVGGGTTDCVMVRLGNGRAGQNDRSRDILGVSGDRVGGTDFDEVLAWRAFMPAFGKDSRLRSGLSMPHSLMHDAISIRDVPAQTRFVRSAEAIERLLAQSAEPHLLERFLTLHSLQLQHQLVHLAESSKIALSAQPQLDAELGFVEAGLRCPLDQAAFAGAVAQQIEKIRALAQQAVDQAGVRPDVVFITGGMAMSPVVSAAIAGIAGPDIPIRSGEMLGTVGKGLGLCAQRIFTQA